MSTVFRILVLFCLAACIMNAFYNLVNNLLYTAQIIVYPDVEGNKPQSHHQAPSTELLQTTTTRYVIRNNKTNTTSNDSDINLETVEKKYPEVRQGGWYTPPNGTIQDKVAIIVPYRDRENHLQKFLNHMHAFLMKQPIEYGIFILEQEGTRLINRGKLLNVGFVESQKFGSWQCFIFHDVDLLPLDQRNIYKCSEQPRHLSVAINVFNYKLPYLFIFGGVTALTAEQFKKVNGYSNRYWGWGGEDDDMSIRLNFMNYRIERYNTTIGRYAMLQHNASEPRQKCKNRHKHLHKTARKFKTDGLASLKYIIRSTTRHHLYTHIVVNLDEGKAKSEESALFEAHMLLGDRL